MGSSSFFIISYTQWTGRSTTALGRHIDRTEQSTEPTEPKIAKIFKRPKIARMARILTIFEPNKSSRRDLFFENFSNFSGTFGSFRSFDFFSSNSLRRCDFFGPKIVKIRAILAIFRPFEDFQFLAVHYLFHTLTIENCHYNKVCTRNKETTYRNIRVKKRKTCRYIHCM